MMSAAVRDQRTDEHERAAGTGERTSDTERPAVNSESTERQKRQPSSSESTVERERQPGPARAPYGSSATFWLPKRLAQVTAFNVNARGEPHGTGIRIEHATPTYALLEIRAVQPGVGKGISAKVPLSRADIRALQGALRQLAAAMEDD